MADLSQRFRRLGSVPASVFANPLSVLPGAHLPRAVAPLHADVVLRLSKPCLRQAVSDAVPRPPCPTPRVAVFARPRPTLRPSVFPPHHVQVPGACPPSTSPNLDGRPASDRPKMSPAPSLSPARTGKIGNAHRAWANGGAHHRRQSTVPAPAPNNAGTPEASWHLAYYLTSLRSAGRSSCWRAACAAASFRMGSYQSQSSETTRTGIVLG